MTTNQLPIKVTPLDCEHSILYWPKEVPEEAYTLTYTHSHLELSKNKAPLKKNLLYEAWAFDGKKSWHIWLRDDGWVCTTYDTTKVKEEDSIEIEQLLAQHIAKDVNKSTLIIHQTIAYDSDHQAYIAYSCPINLK